MPIYLLMRLNILLSYYRSPAFNLGRKPHVTGRGKCPAKADRNQKLAGRNLSALQLTDPQLRMQIPVKTDRLKNNQISLVSSGRSGWLVLLVAVAAVHRPGAIGLEGNLTCLSALCAGGIVHLSWAAAKAASVAASISFHLNSLTFVSTQRIDICHKNISVKNPLNRCQCSRLPMANPDYIPVGLDTVLL